MSADFQTIADPQIRAGGPVQKTKFRSDSINPDRISRYLPGSQSMFQRRITACDASMPSDSAAHPFALGIEERLVDQGRLAHLAQDFDLDLAARGDHLDWQKSQGNGFPGVVGVAA